ncbi:hypothetical protein M3231_17650 [Neobacillus mesonae]|nr:hypothetical protein [Neobacillus mesonae]
MKKILMFLIVPMVIMSFVGCSNAKPPTEDVTDLRQAAWSSLSENAKEEVVGDWKFANVERVELNVLPIVQSGGKPPQVDNLYRVTFKTNRDEFLGPIQVYVDGDSKEIVSYGARL